MDIPGGGYDFDKWIVALAPELASALGMTEAQAAAYIDATGLDCWRDMYDDGLTPTEAADEEAFAAAAL